MQEHLPWWCPEQGRSQLHPDLFSALTIDPGPRAKWQHYKGWLSPCSRQQAHTDCTWRPQHPRSNLGKVLDNSSLQLLLCFSQDLKNKLPAGRLALGDLCSDLGVLRGSEKHQNSMTSSTGQWTHAPLELHPSTFHQKRLTLTTPTTHQPPKNISPKQY